MVLRLGLFLLMHLYSSRFQVPELLAPAEATGAATPKLAQSRPTLLASRRSVATSASATPTIIPM